MRSIAISVFAGGIALAGWILLPLNTYPAVAQSGALYVNLVELDIVPAEMDKFMVAIKENGANAVKEPGCREFNIAVSQKDPNHVVLFEVYDNAAALETHRATDHFKKYAATVKDMVAKRNVQGLSSVAMNSK
jgi:(4S)-4-hydroxy-5-phosphonooxypentane-2,3-dione isomerase